MRYTYVIVGDMVTGERGSDPDTRGAETYPPQVREQRSGGGRRPPTPPHDGEGARRWSTRTDGRSIERRVRRGRGVPCGTHRPARADRRRYALPGVGRDPAPPTDTTCWIWIAGWAAPCRSGARRTSTHGTTDAATGGTHATGRRSTSGDLDRALVRRDGHPAPTQARRYGHDMCVDDDALHVVLAVCAGVVYGRHGCHISPRPGERHSCGTFLVYATNLPPVKNCAYY